MMLSSETKKVKVERPKTSEPEQPKIDIVTEEKVEVKKEMNE
jgi:hypothetical protein